MKSLMIASAIAMMAAPALADSITILYPQKYCDSIESQEYSTGGDQMVEYVEILCKDSSGKYRGFIAQWNSVSGLFGFGRYTIHDARHLQLRPL